jgi:hypothetical protein
MAFMIVVLHQELVVLDHLNEKFCFCKKKQI